MFRLEIKTGGAAFKDPYTGEDDNYSEALEIRSIMAKVMGELDAGSTGGVVIDTNGNKVGQWSR